MVRQFAIVVLFAVLPLAPAAAVVAIALPASEVPPVAGRVPPPAVDAGPLGLTFGEIAAGLAGFAVVGLTMFSGRKPYSVTA